MDNLFRGILCREKGMPSEGILEKGKKGFLTALKAERG